MTQSTPAADNFLLLHFDDHGAEGRVARVTFNNPEKRNSLGANGKEAFTELVTSLRHDDSLRALVITGAGDKSFVGGTDLSETAKYGPAAGEQSGVKTHRVCDAVRNFPVPVIARINGYCFGLGMELAACADMRVAAEHAKFGMPETRFGIISGMEASVLPRLIGWGKTCELVLTGDHIDAAEAYRIGYLEKLVPYADLDAAVDRWIDSLLLCGPNAVRLQKRLIINWDRMSPTDGVRAGIETYVDCYRTDEPNRMMTAFLNRKKK